MAVHLPSFKCGIPLAKTPYPSTSSHRLQPPVPKPIVTGRLCGRPNLAIERQPSEGEFVRDTMVSVSNRLSNRAYWASISADIEAHLKKAIPIRPPISVFEPMHHLTFAAPESTVPAFCVAACELVGGHRDQAMAAASALQLVHAAAFAHEKLMSGGKPGPKGALIYGPNIELLTPDGMFPFGLELVAASSNDPAHLMRVIVEITRAAGSEGVVHGKFNELQYGSPPDGDESVFGMDTWIDQVCKKKEGRLHACAGACGAILGGGSKDEIDKLRMFGLYAGTIRGILNSVELREEDNRLIKTLRDLALRNLEGFEQGKIVEFSSLISELEPLEACMV